MVLATTHRWRSLTITYNDSGCQFLIERLGRTVFPLLTHLSISRCGNDRPKFLYPECVPAIKHLETCITAFTPPFPSALEELAIGSPDLPMLRTSCSLQIPSLQGLKALSFRGHTGEWRIRRGSIYLPLLTRLSFDVSHAEELLRIFSVPSLTHVNYLQRRYETMLAAFNGIPSKLENVHKLRLKLPSRESYPTREDYHAGLIALCLAAPEVRGMEAMAYNLDELLDCQQGVYPIDHWVHLEKFTVIGDVYQLNEMGRYIAPWLKQRRNMGKPALKLSFTLVRGDKAELETFILDDIGQYCGRVDLRMEETFRTFLAFKVIDIDF